MISIAGQMIHAQKSHTFCGQVTNVDQDKVDFAHVINRNTEKAVITKEDGSFCITVASRDTILIKTLRYVTDTVVVNDSILQSDVAIQIKLKPRSYPISEVRIYPYKNYEEFKRAFLNHDPEQYGLNPQDEDRIPMMEDEEYINSLGFLLNSPISYLYYNLSKEEQDKRRAHELRKEEKKNRIIEKKYNREIIKQITGLKKEEEVTEFIIYCRFSQSYLLNATEYEILKSIQRCYKAFKHKQLSE